MSKTTTKTTTETTTEMTQAEMLGHIVTLLADSFKKPYSSVEINQVRDFDTLVSMTNAFNMHRPNGHGRVTIRIDW